MRRIVLYAVIVLTAAMSVPAQAQAIWPVQRELERTMAQLGIDGPQLVRRLGIDLEAEKRWAQHAARVCATTSLVGSACSTEGKTIEELRSRARSGEPVHQNNFAYILDRTSSSPEAMKETWASYMAAANQGMPHAQVSVGWKLLHGLGVARDPEAAFEWNLKGAKQGHPEGANNVGFQYLNGIGVAKDVDLAMSWYSYAAIRGSPEAVGSLVLHLREKLRF